MTGKVRLLHPRLAGIIATLRHGEMIFVADAGSGTSPKSLVPLDDSVEVVDVAVATGLPTVADVVSALHAVGDFEAAIVAAEMTTANPAGRKAIGDLVGAANVHEIPYLPDMYQLRDRCKVFVQTGDCGVHANMILVAGYPSPPIPLAWMTSSQWFTDLVQQRAADGEG
ncbi:RbsD/FucU domain-containing protein [Saccharopolyspora sp. ASAGF58]|uniref:RbsD/FucU domain-containing protein n=1 Tax=Saccharopolyspora sp. ASAGF58 TaxID=2719023 RepID=UPI00143FEDB9|nr:RbsD/FucU domain-containing protein [Saccharopolyspora sp. ASAGF58]QIZ37794.1 D-ribose pyranase [Saccharopolyspora sp. ASAGF58]